MHYEPSFRPQVSQRANIYPILLQKSNIVFFRHLARLFSQGKKEHDVSILASSMIVFVIPAHRNTFSTSQYGVYHNE